MLKAKDALTHTTKTVALIQISLTCIASGAALMIKGTSFSGALLYGGACTLLGTLMHAWLLHRATTDQDGKPTVNVALFFQGILLKWGVMAGMLAIGMKFLELEPAAVLIGFAVAYIGFMFSRGYAPRSRS